MKYNKTAFLRLPDDKKAEIVCRELSLETHNATSKEDLLLLLDWCFHEQYECDKPCSKHKERCRGLNLVRD